MASAAEILSAIDAALLRFAESGAAQTITLSDGKTVTFATLDALMRVRQTYAQLAQVSGTGKAPLRMYGVGFRGPS